MFAHFGRLLFELLKFSTLSPGADAARASSSRARSAPRPAYAQGKGVLFFTGHFGFWELQRDRPCAAGEPIGVLARALDNPQLHELLEQRAQGTGNTVIYRQGAVRKVLRALRSGQGVAMLIDQHMHSPDAIYVDFFERPAATTSTLAALALRTGAPVVPVFALPLPGGRYRMIYEHAGRAAAAGQPGRHPRVHAALHRRARDVRAPLSRAVAVDAPALARRAAAGEQPGDVPAPARADEEPRWLSACVVLAPNWLGDVVMALPALAAVRAHLGAHLAVAARAPVAPLYAWCRASTKRHARVARRPVAASSRGGATPSACRPAVSTALLLPNSFLSAWIVSQAAIPERWGYATDLRGPLLTRRIARTTDPRRCT